MIDGLKPYPAYKETGAPWLGKVPEHWGVRRIKTLFREKDERSGSGDGVLLSLTRLRGIIPQSAASAKIGSAEDLSKYKVCRVGDLVMNRMQAWSGMFALSEREGLISPDYSLFIPKVRLEARFFVHAFKTPGAVDEFARASKGIGSGFNRLYTPEFGEICAAVPPVEEQRLINLFLADTERRIGNYVLAKQKFIRLLEEQKRAIIHRAVTRGLEPNVRFKSSYVEWLGEIPEHWEVLPIKRAFLSMDYGISESASDEGRIRLLTMGNIKDGRVGVPKSGGVAMVEPSLLLRPNDLLFNRTNSAELVGKVGLFAGADEDVTFASYLVRMRPLPKHEPHYLNLVLNDRALLSAARRESIPSLHQSNLNPTRYGRLQIALPPLDEQRDILSRVQADIFPLVEGGESAAREITLLREYRTRLIADVVTGKLDVRAAAANLPDTPLDADASEELETADIDEDATEDDLIDEEAAA